VNPPRLFHYTDINGLGGILSSGGLLNSRIRASGDAEEMRVAATILDEVKMQACGRPPTRKDFDVWSRCRAWAGYSDDLGMTCFSEDENSSALWKFPDPDEPTVALELELAPFLAAALDLDPTAQLLLCIADPAEQLRLADELREKASRMVDSAVLDAAGEALLQAESESLAYRFVYAGYGGEREWRLLVDASERTSDSLLIKPAALPLCRVIIEPGKEGCEGEVSELLAKHLPNARFTPQGGGSSPRTLLITDA
jgi:hypothetical protein